MPRILAQSRQPLRRDGLGRRRGFFAGAVLLALLPSLTAFAQREQGILMAVGSYGDLAVVLSSQRLRGTVAPVLDRINAPVTFVIREEPTFNLDFFVGDQWKYAHDYKNLLLVVDWRDGGAVVGAVEKMLGKGDLARLRGAEGGLVQLVDPLLGYQFAILVAANDTQSLASLLQRNAARIRDLIERQNRERIRRQFARDGVHEELLSKYWRQHRFLLTIPKAYRENQVEPGGFAGIEWVRNGPTRGITLTWERTADPAKMLADRRQLLAMRQQMGRILHREDVSDADLTWGETRLGDLPAIELRGSWVSREIQVGGAFWCYFVADPSGGRVFCLDVLAFQPDVDEPKMPYFREMAAIAETFALQQPHR